jgi:hypothetical protein
LETKRIDEDEKKKQKGQIIMPVEYFIRFQGKRYDVGTTLKFYPYGHTWFTPMTGVIEEFIGTACFIRGDDGKIYTFSTVCQENGHKAIVEIINPIYYVEKREIGNGGCLPSWKVEGALIWYIIIMMVGALFKARLLIWVIVSIFFFAWAIGRFKNNN